MHQIVKLGYEDYFNSEGNIDNVVTTVEQGSIIKNNNTDANIVYPNDEQNKKYNRLENELESLIAKNLEET